MKQPYKIKQIKWRDSQLYITQEPMQDFEVSIIKSIGYVIQEDKTKVVLAGELIGEEFRRVIVIPKENIICNK